ncbi:DNA glycosylase AlkZ-like family protein [Microbacterium gorillae]|uniref:DNA glycosylase AlkZ-like family protein n=1 Tax=Microbacterium gorillae TaxID=1231063 RepID=UPI00058D57BB|nr:crosslink repair DNA glycosylase YcaQ family protein [Microbacterium gorillae]
MSPDGLRAARLRSHLLTAPAATIVDAARHQCGTQAQELWGGRFALSARVAGAPTARAVDAAFDAGEIVRTWPMRGTLHILAAEDVDWMLSITSARVRRSAAGRHRELELEDDDFSRAEQTLRRVLASGGLRRAHAFAALTADGVETTGQRGAHLLLALAITGVVHWGATVPRPDGAPATEQLLTLNDDLPTQRTVAGDATAELLRRYLQGHAPASIADFAWWAGLPITPARAAAVVARDDESPLADDVLLDLDASGRVVVAEISAADATPDSLLALPTFEEYYISYADRSRVASDDVRAAVGPGRNGMVRAILLRRGEVVGTWTRAGELSVLAPDLASRDAEAALETWRTHAA